jgi:serine/threonine-protein kinase
MSPEQVRGIGAVDARTDLYAMGAVLHEMLTGGKLFDAEGAFGVMRAHMDTEPALPSSRNQKVPAALDDVVRRALAKDPAERFPSADEFRLALENGVADARPLAVQSSPFAGPASKLRGFLPSRTAVLMALAPAALLAGFCTVRFFPSAARVQSTASGAPPAPVAELAPLAKDDTAQVSATVAEPVAPEDPGVVSSPAEVPVTKEKPPARVRSRAPIHVPAKRPDSQAEPSYAIRVTGGESLPAVVVPAASPVPARSVETIGPCVPTTDSVQLPEAKRSAASGTAPELEPAPHQSASAKPRNSGNRLLRALGKLNPFHKRTKQD